MRTSAKARDAMCSITRALNKCGQLNADQCEKEQKSKQTQFSRTWASQESKSRRFNKKILEPINALYKVAGFKINIQKSAEFLYTSNEASERQIKKAIQFTFA